MFSMKKSSFFLIALATIAFYPLAACADKDLNTATESKEEGKELKSVKIKLHGNKGTRSYEGDYDEVDVRASGGTDLTMKGTAKKVYLDISGSADIDLKDLEADAVDVNISGSADVTVYVNKSVDINMSGSGDLHLYGKGSIRSYSKSGSGKVHNHLGK